MLSDPHLPGMVVPVIVSPMGQIVVFSILDKYFPVWRQMTEITILALPINGLDHLKLGNNWVMLNGLINVK